MAEQLSAQLDEEFQNDPRTACKYGKGCYQKNPQHHKRFKHPPVSPKRTRDADSEEEETEAKKAKIDPGVPDETLTGDTSDSNSDAESDEDAGRQEEQSHSDTEDSEPGEPEPWEVDAPPSPQDPHQDIRDKFLINVPDDFFDLWHLCERLNKEKPEEAFSSVGLTLVGPYDILSGKLKKLKDRKLANYLCHWRYYYDLPEFTTVIAGSEDEYHIGYYRDDCHKLPVLVGSMSAKRTSTITLLGENLFAAVWNYINEKVKSADPFKKTTLNKLCLEVEKFSKEKNHSLEKRTANIRNRSKKVVTNCFHGVGIVVPVKDDVGYREVPETNASLKKMLQKVLDAKTENEKLKCFDPIQEVLTNIQFGMDEGDFGMGLEFGHNLFVFGGEVLHKTIKHVLGVAYDLLNRDLFNIILQAHLQNRRKGSNMSIMEAQD